MPTATQLKILVEKLQTELGKDYELSYKGVYLYVKVPYKDDRKNKEVEILEMIKRIDDDKNDGYLLKIIYEDEVIEGISYRREIAEDLNVSLQIAGNVYLQQSKIYIDIKGGSTDTNHALTLKDISKAVVRHTYFEVIKEYPYRSQPIIFHLRFIGGTIDFAIGTSNNLILEKLEPLDKLDVKILENLCTNQNEGFQEISYLPDYSKDEFVFSLERLAGNDVIEIENFNPDTYINVYNNGREKDNFPTSFQVKLNDSKYLRYF
ncbi:hypothetical protein ACFGVS_18380 [Mucilaginibacter sp. AW1-7]|uniref:hypothetical protein n=1 Tax=Mucilaginibacter sp. AW1-7 TaxID=3349874 RepID=UPI003F73A738